VPTTPTIIPVGSILANLNKGLENSSLRAVHKHPVPDKLVRRGVIHRILRHFAALAAECPAYPLRANRDNRPSGSRSHVLINEPAAVCHRSCRNARRRNETGLSEGGPALVGADSWGPRLEAHLAPPALELAMAGKGLPGARLETRLVSVASLAENNEVLAKASAGPAEVGTFPAVAQRLSDEREGKK